MIAITDEYGKTVAKYSYDAWGKCTIVEDTSERGIATINPYRYRSYYYDSEIGMYYLQSRYYDPEIGLFVNMDKPETLTAFTGTQFSNLANYCINNPISFCDNKGEYPVLVGAGLQVSFAVSFGGLSIGAGFELIYFWTSKFKTNNSSRFLLYFYFEPLNFSLSTLKNAININSYYNKVKFNPKKLISKPSFNAAVSLLTIWADHKKTFNYRDYEGRFDTWTLAAWGVKTFKSWSSIFTVYGAGKYWGVSGGGTSRSVSNYWMVLDLGNSMKALMESIKRQA